jgi:AraC family transcriptional regulator
VRIARRQHNDRVEDGRLIQELIADIWRQPADLPVIFSDRLWAAMNSRKSPGRRPSCGRFQIVKHRSDSASLNLARLAPGQFEVIHSCRPPGQASVLLERHHYWPGERGHISLDWHSIVLLRSAANRCVRTNAQGESVPMANTRGAMAVLPAGCGPPVRLTTSCDVVVYAFAPTVLASLGAEVAGQPVALEHVPATRDPDLQDLLRLLDRELEAGGPSGRLYLDGLSFAVLARTCALSNPQARPLSFEASPLNLRAQRRLFEFIEENLHRNLGLEELASQVGYSRGHFLKMFRVATGNSPHQYMTLRRIERAKLLLTDGRVPLSEVALSCGFSSQSHFSTEFRRRVGLSPARFRRKR